MGGSNIGLVRSAVAAYLTNARIPGLDTVFKHAPFDEGEIAWNVIAAPGQEALTFGVVFVDAARDQMIAMDGRGGRRATTYDVVFAVMTRDISGDSQAAGDRWDAVTAGVKGALMADPALGTDQSVSGVIEAGTRSLSIGYGRPERYGEGNTWAAVAEFSFQVTAYEWST